MKPAYAVLTATLFLSGEMLWEFVKNSGRRLQWRKDKAIREHLSERQIDKMIMDSFPASDPPSTY